MPLSGGSLKTQDWNVTPGRGRPQETQAEAWLLKDKSLFCWFWSPSNRGAVVGETEIGREVCAGFKVCRGEGSIGNREWDRGECKEMSEELRCSCYRFIGLCWGEKAVRALPHQAFFH